MKKNNDEISARDAIQFSDDFIYSLDYRGYVTMANPSVERLLHFEKDSIVGKHFSSFVREDWRERAVDFFQEHFQRKSPNMFFEVPLLTGDGGSVWMEMYTRTIFDDGTGRITGYQTIARDVTKRRLAEEELRDSRSNLVDIINYLPDPTFVINKDGVITAWNQALEQLTGIPQNAMLGKGNHEYSVPFYGDRRPLLVDFALERPANPEDLYSIMKVERDTLIAEIYTPFLREGGAYLWEKAKPLYDATGAVAGAIETVRDLTERKQAEEALRNITQQVVRHQLALHELSKMTAPDLDGALRNIIEIDARTLAADRVSVWFREQASGELFCRLRFVVHGGAVEGGERISAGPESAHLRALEAARILAIADAGGDADLRSLMGDYLAGAGIVSIMSVTIRLGGSVTGFVCHEQAARREWNLEEQDFATSIADLISLSIETSERNRAELALQEQKRFTENLIENSALATIVIDRGHRIMLWNKACEELTGFPAAEMIGTDLHWKPFYATRRSTLADLMLEDRYDALPEHYATCSKSILTPDGWHAEGWYRNLGGRDRYILFESTPIRNNRGEIIAAVENIQDITELKLADEEMVRMRSYLKNMIDSMPSILLGVDLEGRITHWNMEAGRITGIPEHGAIGRMITEILPALAPQLDNVRLAIEKKEPQKVERVSGRLTGDEMFFDVMVYPLIDSDVQGAVIRVDDVTRRVRIEEMMVQTEKMLSVGGLAAGMAHEINNPLGGILLGAQNILRRVSPDLAANAETARECGTSIEAVLRYMEARKITKMIDGIREMGERASKIVSNMLSFSRQSESRMSVAGLADVIDKTLELAANDYDLKKKYDFRHIRVVKEYAPDVPDIQCVVTEIQQVVLNLLKNSAQAIAEKEFGEGDGPVIILRLAREGDWARIELEDNGPGIEETVRKRVFEPFFTTKEVGVGTGLGLSVSYFIITNNHKGAMEVESRPGEGTKFIIHLPLTGRSA